MPKPRILVADDNPLSLRFLAEAIGGFGYEVVEAADGGVALNCANGCACDVLLLDVRMPRLGGAEVLARVRAHAGPSRAAIAVATTADTDLATHAALRKAGFAEVLPKPLGIAALRSALARHAPIPACAEACSDIHLDDEQALAAAGGDVAIVAALRGLLARELESLPDELAGWGKCEDATALRERLHRLDASAGFCGVPALLRAASALRTALDAPLWPHAAIGEFLAACERSLARLSR